MNIYGRVGWRPADTSTLWDDIYAVWNADGNANDSYGTNNGTLMNGATFTTGKIGQAFTFDGINDFIQLPNNSLNFTDSFSIGFWMNLNGVGADQQAPIANFMLAGGNYYGWATFIQNSTFYFNIYNGTTTAKQVTYGIGPQYYNWYYYEISYEWGVALRIKINGNIVATLSTTTTPVYATTIGTNHTPAIGAWKREGGTTSYFMKNGGKIDAVSAWNKILTPSETVELYNAGAGKQYPN